MALVAQTLSLEHHARERSRSRAHGRLFKRYGLIAGIRREGVPAACGRSNAMTLIVGLLDWEVHGGSGCSNANK